MSSRGVEICVQRHSYKIFCALAMFIACINSINTSLNQLACAYRAKQGHQATAVGQQFVLMQNCKENSLGGRRPLEWIAEQTSRYSGADLHELATEAARHSVRQTTAILSSLRYVLVTCQCTGCAIV